jgi:hypothetical protein
MSVILLFDNGYYDVGFERYRSLLLYVLSLDTTTSSLKRNSLGILPKLDYSSTPSGKRMSLIPCMASSMPKPVIKGIPLTSGQA